LPETQKVDIKNDSVYHINWDASTDANYVKKELVNAFRARAKRVIIHVYNSQEYEYFEKLREFLGEFISQTIIIVREQSNHG
jgi:IS1 family transposase